MPGRLIYPSAPPMPEQSQLTYNQISRLHTTATYDICIRVKSSASRSRRLGSLDLSDGRPLQAVHRRSPAVALARARQGSRVLALARARQCSRVGGLGARQRCVSTDCSSLGLRLGPSRCSQPLLRPGSQPEPRPRQWLRRPGGRQGLRGPCAERLPASSAQSPGWECGRS